MMADGNTLLYVDAVDTWHGWKSSTSKHFFNTLQEVDAAKNNQICLGELLAMPTIDANARLFQKDNCSSPCNWTCNFSKRKTERGIQHCLPCIALGHRELSPNLKVSRFFEEPHDVNPLMFATWNDMTTSKVQQLSVSWIFCFVDRV